MSRNNKNKKFLAVSMLGALMVGHGLAENPSNISRAIEKIDNNGRKKQTVESENAVLKKLNRCAQHIEENKEDYIYGGVGVLGLLLLGTTGYLLLRSDETTKSGTGVSEKQSDLLEDKDGAEIGTDKGNNNGNNGKTQLIKEEKNLGQNENDNTNPLTKKIETSENKNPLQRTSKNTLTLPQMLEPIDTVEPSGIPDLNIWNAGRDQAAQLNDNNDLGTSEEGKEKEHALNRRSIHTEGSGRSSLANIEDKYSGGNRTRSYSTTLPENTINRLAVNYKLDGLIQNNDTSQKPHESSDSEDISFDGLSDTDNQDENNGSNLEKKGNNEKERQNTIVKNKEFLKQITDQLEIEKESGKNVKQVDRVIPDKQGGVTKPQILEYQEKNKNNEETDTELFEKLYEFNMGLILKKPEQQKDITNAIIKHITRCSNDSDEKEIQNQIALQVLYGIDTDMHPTTKKANGYTLVNIKTPANEEGHPAAAASINKVKNKLSVVLKKMNLPSKHLHIRTPRPDGSIQEEKNPIVWMITDKSENKESKPYHEYNQTNDTLPCYRYNDIKTELDSLIIYANEQMEKYK